MIPGHVYVVESMSGEVHVGTFLCCDDGARPTLILDCCTLDLLQVERVASLTDMLRGAAGLPPELVARVARFLAGHPN